MTFADFYDPHARRHPLPTFPYFYAPDGMATLRQLRAAGLRPGGQPVAGADPVAPRQTRRLPLPPRTGPYPNAPPPPPSGKRSPKP